MGRTEPTTRTGFNPNLKLFLFLVIAGIVALGIFTVGKGLYDNYQEGLARDRAAQAEKVRELERQVNLDQQRKEVEEQQAAEQKAQQRQQEYKAQLDQMSQLKSDLRTIKDRVSYLEGGVQSSCVQSPTEWCESFKSNLATSQGELKQKVDAYNTLSDQIPPDVAKYPDKFDQNGNAVQ